MAMKAVGIADLKARLSAHLRAVRRGHSITVLDRQTPVARLVPYGPEPSGLVVRRPLPGAPRIQDVKLPPPVKLGFDVVDLLLEERQGGR
jgi:prevent-host-death family protein